MRKIILTKKKVEKLGLGGVAPEFRFFKIIGEDKFEELKKKAEANGQQNSPRESALCGDDGSKRETEADKELYIAAKKGDVGGMEKARKKGGRLGVKDEDGHMDLMAAAMFGGYDAVEWLLDEYKKLYGGDKLKEYVNDKDNEGHTVLMCGVRSYRFHVVKLLLDNGAKINPKDNHGKTALYYVPSGSGAFGEHLTTKIINLLKNDSAETRLHTTKFHKQLPIADRILCDLRDAKAFGHAKIANNLAIKYVESVKDYVYSSDMPHLWPAYRPLNDDIREAAKNLVRQKRERHEFVDADKICAKFEIVVE